MVQEISATRKFSGYRKPRPPSRMGVQRYQSGRIINRDVGESEEAIMDVAISARAKHLNLPKKLVKADASRGDLATVIGRLSKTGLISPTQRAAAFRYARVISLRDLIDDVRPAYGIPAAARLASTFGSDPYDNIDPDLAWDTTDAKRRRDILTRIKRDFADLTRVMWEMQCNLATVGAGPILTSVIMRDVDCVTQSIGNMGTLRCALNVLAKTFGIEGQGS